MSEKVELSRQQQKSRETKEKIFQAAKRILQKKGYEELSIKNICEEAGVSNGSFYHHFRTKDDLLSYYIETERPYPIVTVQTYVEKAIAAGIVSLNVKIEEFTTDIRMIVIGNVFEWCLRNGEADFEGNMSRSLGKYLDSTLCEGKSEE